MTSLASASVSRSRRNNPRRKNSSEIVVTGSRIARDVKDASTPLAVISSEEIKLSGTKNIDKMLGDQPQFVQATNGGATANKVPAGSAAGAAYVNLRGFGPTRSLTLVNGRRFAIFGPEQVTDLNTIPTALIERTEVVTGGSSAVYGSDAITGVVNFIMRDDFDGIEVGGQYGFDSSTNTPTFNVDLTAGSNFAEGRGNIVASLNYYKREGFTRDERGDWAELPIRRSLRHPGFLERQPDRYRQRLECRQLRGIRRPHGFRFRRQRRHSQRALHADQRAAGGRLQTAAGAAGLAGIGANGFTFNDAGARPAAGERPADDFNLTQFNYLQVPQER